MDAARFARVRAIVLEALARPVAEREALLAERCAGDSALATEVRALLAQDAGAGPEFLRTMDPGEHLERLAARLGPLDPEGAVPEEAAEAAPERIGPYRLCEEIGRGGMGVVYRAEQTAPIRREVAIKLVKRGMDTEAVIARFRAERQALASMDHPNIARVFDAGATEDGRPYFVMEYVPGRSLTRYCDEQRLGPNERLRLFLELCRAVQHAHQRGMLHRDLKPSNVLAFESDEGVRVKVIDFGIAKAIEDPVPGMTVMTRVGQLVGTPEYMSPEQAGIVDQPVDTRSDVYSLGALLYELLSGRRPYRFTRYSVEEIQRTFRETDPLRPSTAITASDPSTPTDASSSDAIGHSRRRTPQQLRRELSGDLDNIVLKAMHKEPDRRYASVDALADDIRRHQQGRPVNARADSWAYRSSKFVRRNALGVGLAAAAVVALAGFSVYTAVQSSRLARERDRAIQAEVQAQREAETAEQVSDFLVGIFEVSDPNEARGRTVTAREVLEEGAKRLDSELQEQPRVRARLLNTIGAVYENLGLYEDARGPIDEGLRLRRQWLGDDDPEVAESLVQKAWLLRDTGHSDEALPLIEHALEIQRAAYGEEHPDINETLYHLGSTYEELGRYDDAIALYRQVLELDHRLLGEDDPHVGESLNNLAVALSGQGAYAEAESLYRESLAFNRRVLGEDHPEVATSMANLSNLVFQHVDQEEGLALAEQALEMRRRILGDEHPATAIAAGNLGIKYYRLGRLEEAETLLRQSLATKQRTQGMRHPSTAHAWILLGLTQLGQEAWAAAESSYVQAVSIDRESLPPGHFGIARALEGLGRAYCGQGRWDEARPLYEEALAIRRAALPADHREVCDSLRRLAQLERHDGRLDAAAALLEEAYAALERTQGPGASRTRTTGEELARVYEAQGRTAEARELRAALAAAEGS